MAGLDPITAGLSFGQTLIERIWPDKTQQVQAQAALTQMAVSGELQQILGQIDIDKAEAASDKVFVSGWRPFVGWICGAGFGYQFLLAPLLNFGFAKWGFHAPELDVSALSTLLMAMLGMGALRTVDKIKGVGNGQ